MSGRPIKRTLRHVGFAGPVTLQLRLPAVFDARHGGFATGWGPVSWGSIDELFVNLTIP